MNEQMKNGVLFLSVCILGALFTFMTIERVESLEVQEDFRNQNTSIILEMK